MIKNSQLFFFLYFSWLLVSCGGVVGNIGKYSFPDISSDSLKHAMNKVYREYPELIKTDTTLYGKNNGMDFYYIYHSNGYKYVFLCNVIAYQSPNDKEVELSLTAATKWGEIMKLSTKMRTKEKREYEQLFEKNILPKIKAALK